MVPLMQQDYAKYMQLFRGNHYKGASLLKSLLMNSDRADEIVNSLPACCAIFTDMSRSKADSMCADLLGSYTQYSSQAVETYIIGNKLTAKTSIKEMINDIEEVKRVAAIPDIFQPFTYSNYVQQNLLRTRANFEALVIDRQKENTKIFFAAGVQKGYAALLKNLVSFNPYSVCNAAITAAGYVVVHRGLIHPIDKWKQLLIAYCVKDSSNYRYPVIMRYSITNNTAEIVLIDKTHEKAETTQESGICPAPAYDEDNDVVYAFYNNVQSVSNIYCAAAKLTQTSKTELFSGKVAGNKDDGSTCFTILLVYARAGRAYCCWHNRNFYETYAPPPPVIKYCVMLQGGTAEVLGQTLATGRVLNSPKDFSCYASGLASQAVGSMCAAWHDGTTVQQVVLAPYINGSTPACLEMSVSAPNTYLSTAYGTPVAIPRSGVALFCPRAASSSNTYSMSMYVLFDNTVRYISDNNKTTGFQGIKYDAFTDTVYFFVTNATNTIVYYAVNAKGLSVISKELYDNAAFTASTQSSNQFAFTKASRFLATNRSDKLYNIEPLLVDAL